MISVRFYDCEEKEIICYIKWNDAHLSKRHMKIIVSELRYDVHVMHKKQVVADIHFGSDAKEFFRKCPIYGGDITVSIISFKEKYGRATVFIDCNKILREFEVI